MTTKQNEIPKSQDTKKVNDIKTLLDEQIKKWEQLSKKIAQLDKFTLTQTRLTGYSESLNNEKAKNTPETDSYFIKLCSKLQYREEETISINNIFIIEEFLTFIKAKISLKIAELEKEIIL